MLDFRQGSGSDVGPGERGRSRNIEGAARSRALGRAGLSEASQLPTPPYPNKTQHEYCTGQFRITLAHACCTEWGPRLTVSVATGVLSA